MSEKIVARWHDWSGKSLEHLVLLEDSDEIVAESAIIGSIDDDNFAARYRILCDESWRVTEVEINQIGKHCLIEISHRGARHWLHPSPTPPTKSKRGLHSSITGVSLA